MTVYPNLNLLKNTRTTSATSTSSAWGTLFSSEQIYDSAIKSKTGVSAMTLGFDVSVPLNAMVGGAASLQLKGQNSQAHGDVGTNDYNTIICQSWYTIEQSDLGKTIRLSTSVELDPKYQSFDTALADTDSITIRQVEGTPGLVHSKLKLEEGSTATPWLPSSSEVTAEDYPSYIGTYTDKNSNEQSTDPEKYTWKKIE
ncbi:major tail extension protein [Lactococcus phage 56003]|uniref:Major tail extension protein n=1 Tax=Lactococcus phage 56003 TaxID=2029665 RepID=A0A343JPG0_9CAUD|nr:major tail extension protein [Lactococcus phage 56003]ASZ71383.1 major tail extension protein [Lactococcus phage 56003]